VLDVEEVKVAWNGISITPMNKKIIGLIVFSLSKYQSDQIFSMISISKLYDIS